MLDDPISAIIVAGITAIGGIIVAFIANRGGKKTAAADGLPPINRESGEHAHTRDVVRDGIQSLHARFDTMERVDQAIRQSDQIGQSAERLERDQDD